jgi:hypothetical protein
MLNSIRTCVLAAPLALAISACGTSSLGNGAPGGGGGTTGPVTSGTGGQGQGGCSTDTCAVTATSTGSGEGGGATSSGTGQGGAPCGPTVEAGCNANEYCDFSDNLCGEGVRTGACVIKPLDCSGPLPEPTCGCDGTIHQNDCMANLAGFDMSLQGTCTPPAGTFACGQTYCQHAAEYCERQASDVGGEPDVYRCVDLPGACGNSPSCACVETGACPICDENVSGDLFVTCPGG